MNTRELTNRRFSHDDAVGSCHSLASPSCRNLNLRFLMKTTTLVSARQPNFPAVFEVCFRSTIK